MREIKFRFWSNHLGKFVIPSDDIFIGALKDPDMNSMQFTGLVDKNGVEIYEGDIVKQFKDGGWARLEVVEYSAPTFKPTWMQYSFSKVEVIGNIYENPELLK